MKVSLANRMLLVLTLVMPALLVACLGASGDYLKYSLNDGSKVVELADSNSYTMILALSPQECLTCGADLWQWLRTERPETRAVLVLTQMPDSSQTRMLSIRRVPVAGIMKSSYGRKNRGKAILVHKGQLVAEASFNSFQFHALLKLITH
jgi:hypothetical protein